MPNGPPQRRMEAAGSWPCQPAGYGTAGNGGLVMTPYHIVFIQKYAIRSIITIIAFTPTVAEYGQANVATIVDRVTRYTVIFRNNDRWKGPFIALYQIIHNLMSQAAKPINVTLATHIPIK